MLQFIDVYVYTQQQQVLVPTVFIVVVVFKIIFSQQTCTLSSRPFISLHYSTSLFLWQIMLFSQVVCESCGIRNSGSLHLIKKGKSQKQQSCLLTVGFYLVVPRESRALYRRPKVKERKKQKGKLSEMNWFVKSRVHQSTTRKIECADR